MNWYNEIVKIRDNIASQSTTGHDAEILNDMLSFMEQYPLVFIVTEKELKVLQDYFYNRAGFINPEFDAELLKFIQRVDDFIKCQA